MGTRAKMGRVVHMVIPLAVLKRLQKSRSENVIVVHMVIPLAVLKLKSDLFAFELSCCAHGHTACGIETVMPRSILGKNKDVVHMVIPLAVLKLSLRMNEYFFLLSCAHGHTACGIETALLSSLLMIIVVHMVIPLAVWDTVITSQITKAIRWL